MASGRLVLKLKGGIDPDVAKKAITAFGCKIIDHSDRMFLVEVQGEACVDDLHLCKMFAVITPEVMMHKCITVNLCGMTDKDVDNMTEEEVKEKLKNIRDTALWWAAQEDDDRCYLDDLKVLQTILPHGRVNFTMPDDLTFIENCIRFKKTRCPKNPKVHEW
jgi:hypothetical protein